GFGLGLGLRLSLRSNGWVLESEVRDSYRVLGTKLKGQDLGHNFRVGSQGRRGRVSRLRIKVSQDEGSLGNQQWFLSFGHVQGVDSDRDTYTNLILGSDLGLGRDIGMSGFTFITLKLYHGGALLYEGEEARYVGGCILGDIDNDDILLAMCNCLQNGAVLEVYVHMPEEESGATFNKVGTIENRASENIEFNKVAPNTDPSDYEDSEYSVKGYDELTEKSDDSEDSELLEDDQYVSDVHEELIQLRAEKISFLKRRKRRERIPADT
ncbi:hypothetical protein MTR67_025448, partial [Solanum verrucosum]